MKRVLLDTHAFLWWVEGAPRLPEKAAAIVENLENVCFLSLCSCWEMAIKAGLGKLRLAGPIREFVPRHLAANHFKLCPISFRHAARVEQLEWHHRDPFDRLLAAQALEEKMILVSRDPIFDAYGVRRVWREAPAHNVL